MTRAFYEQTAESPSELPEGWAEVVLGDLVVHALGGDWGQEAEGEPEAGRVRDSGLRSRSITVGGAFSWLAAATKKLPGKPSYWAFSSPSCSATLPVL